MRRLEKAQERLKAIVRKLWPEWETMSAPEGMGSVYDVLGILYLAPLALAGLVWLIVITDPSLVRLEWPTLLLLFALLLFFRKLSFFFFTETKTGFYSYSSGSFEGMVLFSAALIFGPTVLWMSVLGTLSMLRARGDGRPRPGCVGVLSGT